MRAVRLIAPQKPDGKIRPIGISEIYRRIITKSISKSIKDDIKHTTGTIQCQGLPAACEAAHKAVHELYNQGEVVLVVDAEAAFKNLNRNQAL